METHKTRKDKYMHDFIIQLETTPISESNRLTVDEMQILDEYEWFFQSISDGVEEDESPDETITDFIEQFQSYDNFVEVGSDDNGKWILFTDGFKRAFFASSYPYFEEALQELMEKTSFEAFCGYEMGSLLYPLQRAYDDKYGLYIKNGDMRLLTLDNFIRHYLQPNVKYYIGGTVDYHC